MSIYFCISIYLLASTILTYVNSQSTIREYLIKKDLLPILKAGEFSVFDTTEKQVYYRIESKYSILQKVEVIAYPSEQVIGRLQAKIKPFLYKAEISVLNSQSNEWINGLIQQNFQLLGSSFKIDWNSHRIVMEGEVIALTTTFRDTNGELLAQFKMRLSSILWTNTYDMQIFSDKFPEQIYLLALAARDQIMSNNQN